jgi:hypothetical protein
VERALPPPKKAPVAQVLEIPASVVRSVVQERPGGGDFRSRFPGEQPAVARYVAEALRGEREVVVEFAGRLAAGLWAIYERATGGSLPAVGRDGLGAVEPAARDLVERLHSRHGNGLFDPEWLVELPREPQPHVMGFLIGALRAARLRLDGAEVLRVSAVVLAVAGALEAVSCTRRAMVTTRRRRQAN